MGSSKYVDAFLEMFPVIIFLCVFLWLMVIAMGVSIKRKPDEKLDHFDFEKHKEKDAV